MVLTGRMTGGRTTSSRALCKGPWAPAGITTRHMPQARRSHTHSGLCAGTPPDVLDMIGGNSCQSALKKASRRRSQVGDGAPVSGGLGVWTRIDVLAPPNPALREAPVQLF